MRPIIAAILLQLELTNNVNVLELGESTGFSTCRLRDACRDLNEKGLVTDTWIKQKGFAGCYKRYMLTNAGRDQLDIARTVKIPHKEKKSPKPKRTDVANSQKGMRQLHMEGHCKAKENLLRGTWNNKRIDHETVDCDEVACVGYVGIEG